MTLRTYIDRAIRDGAAFDAVICGCDVQQTFCWQPDMHRASGFPSSRSARTGSFSATPFRSARRATAARASTGGCFAPDKIATPAPEPLAPGRAFLLPRFLFRTRK